MERNDSMNLMVTLGMMIVLLSVMGLSLIKKYNQQHKQPKIKINNGGITLHQLFKKYHFTNEIDLAKLDLFILEIEQNDLSGVVGDLKSKATAIQQQGQDADKIDQKDYLDFVHSYNHKKIQFERALDVQKSETIDIKKYLLVGLSCGILLISLSALSRMYVLASAWMHI
ncbi:hypothetical protein IV67_GL000348 [Weissella minor]|uniref:Uncharacterized protein n=2 Tax=Weissella minor TaxID=1620 RepID=A0A0R2JQS0_9LACO|nr:hypothetical protein IV67_GL000348 [Weissella minor]